MAVRYTSIELVGEMSEVVDRNPRFLGTAAAPFQADDVSLHCNIISLQTQVSE